MDALAIYVEYRERRFRRKYRHSLDLIKEVFEVGLSEIGHVEYNNDEITPFYVKWTESSSMFPYAVMHLKNRRYKKIWQAYEDGKQYAQSIIDEIVKKIQQYRQVTKQRLIEAKIPIPSSEKFINHQTKHYDQKFVKHVIFAEIEHLLKYGKGYNKLMIQVSAPPNFSNLSWGSSTFAIAEESSLKRLQDIIEQPINDETIVAIVKDINCLEIQLKDNKSLEQFNRGREELVRQVKYGQKALRGKCPFCP